MTKIKEKWSDYSFREKVAIVVGTVVFAIQVFRYATNTLSENNGLELVVFCAASLLVFAPLVIVEIIKKRKAGKE